MIGTPFTNLSLLHIIRKDCFIFRFMAIGRLILGHARKKKKNKNKQIYVLKFVAK